MSFTTNQGSPEWAEDGQRNPPVDIPEVLNEAATGVIDPGRIARLSDPTREELETFRAAWEPLPVSTKREIVREMARQSESDLEVSFARYFKALSTDFDTEVRAIAIRALWEDDSASTLHELCELAKSEQEAPVQESIAVTLGGFSYLADLEELDESDKARMLSALWHLLEHGGSWMVRRRALESLAFMGDDESIKQAIAAWYESDYEQERAGAIAAMGRNLDVRWLPTVITALSDEDPDIRAEAAWAAGQFMDDRAIEPLERAVHDEDEEIRILAIRSIGNIGGQKAIDALTYLRTQVDEELHEPIREAIEEAEIWLGIPDEEF
jgi:HEAT repeat protein